MKPPIDDPNVCCIMRVQAAACAAYAGARPSTTRYPSSLLSQSSLSLTQFDTMNDLSAFILPKDEESR
jgi:hypothetical protein